MSQARSSGRERERMETHTNRGSSTSMIPMLRDESQTQSSIYHKLRKVFLEEPFLTLFSCLPFAILLRYYNHPRISLCVNLLQSKLSKLPFASKIQQYYRNHSHRFSSTWERFILALLCYHVIRRLPYIFRLALPSHNTLEYGDRHYAKSYRYARQILTSLDASMIYAIRITHLLPFKNGSHLQLWSRDIIMVLVSGYYFCCRSEADNVVSQIFTNHHEDVTQRFKGNAINQSQEPITFDLRSVEILRACWEKGRHPLLRQISEFQIPKLGFPGVPIPIPIVAGSEKRFITGYLYYKGNLRQLRNEHRLLYSTPGGGFVCMTPMNHWDYLSRIANETGLPIFSIDYRKAPEFPYPCGLNDCFEVYKALQQTNGAVVGMNCHDSTSPLQVVVMGDSAGGNLLAGTIIRCIEQGNIRLPIGAHFIYPVLDLAAELWSDTAYHSEDKYEHHGHQTENDYDIQTSHIDDAQSKEVGLQDDISHSHYTHSTLPSSIQQIPEELSTSATSCALAIPSLTAPPPPSSTFRPLTSPALSSRLYYSSDCILSQHCQMLIARTYLANGGDPVRDYYISPLRVPTQLLSQFPPTYIHVGSADPLVDDSILFIQKLITANKYRSTKLHVFDGLSHAYLHMLAVLSEADDAVKLSIEWIQELFHDLS